MIDARLYNSRQVLMHAAGDAVNEHAEALRSAACQIDEISEALTSAQTVDAIRGYEGTAANLYFGAFGHMIKSNDPDLQFNGRNRRPPKDPVNALLSYLYTLLAAETEGALESVGLDPACGYMHTLRSGRPALALDLMEEFRAPVCDRIALALINRKQINGKDFETGEDGGIVMKPKARDKLLQVWQEKKRDSIYHPALDEKVSIGLLPYSQALLLARVLRGDTDSYPAFRWR